jgi:hypothetical protein
MNDPGLTIISSRSASRAGVIHALLVWAATLGASVAAAQNVVPAEFQGKWVPARATCASPAAVLITANRLTLVNGNDREALGGIEMAGPGYFPPDYNGIMAVLITEFSGQQPLTATFNVNEKKGVAQVEFAPLQPGASNALLRAYNARISKLNLARRYPLHAVPLKKCPRVDDRRG